MNIEFKKSIKTLAIFTALFWQGQAQAYDHSVEPTTIQVPINKSRIIPLDRSDVGVTASKPEIAQLRTELIRGGRKLLVYGEQVGTTNLMILDAKQNVTKIFDIEVTHDLDGLKKKLYEVMPNEHIEVRSAQQCIVLGGEVSNLVNMDFAIKIAQGYVTAGLGQGGSGGGSQGGCTNVSGGSGGGGGGGSSNQAQRFIVNMMHVGGEQQVMLEVKIAEVKRSVARELQLNSSASKTSVNDGTFVWDVLSAGAGLFTGSYVAGDALFSWQLLFSRDSDIATILAEPNLTTISGRKAAFLSGGEFPYAADCSLGNCQVNFKKFGVGLEFTPIVLDSNRISLKTHVAVSALTNDAAIITEVASVTPSLSTREADTTLEMADGQTMSIAGLISENNDNTQQQTPGLADIPMLGALFRNRQSFNEKKELVILVTPHLARPIPRDQLSLPIDNYVQPDDIDFYLLGRMEARSEKSARQVPVYDPSSGGTTGQFGHQIQAEDM